MAGRQRNRGMNEQQVNSLKKEKYVKPKKEEKEGVLEDGQEMEEVEEDKCAICLIEFQEGLDVRKLPCDHIFHPQCIDSWLEITSTCPLCKRDLKQMI